MFDETEMKFQLTDRLNEIEAALRNVVLPPLAIDQDNVMYQAGWAAAMASRDDSAIQVASRSRAWPALALTFAATTAACLVVMFANPADVVEESAIQVASVSTPENVQITEPMPANNTAATVLAANVFPQAKQRGSFFDVAELFGLSRRNISNVRDAQIERLLSESRRSTPVSYTSTFDSDTEPVQPLTPSDFSKLLKSGQTL